ncbi:MAG: hypothetical protein IJ679_09610 [Lachnospiraceae bacterium]|nr:hypothetical protein [Lachnospiraceae bacterium]
MVGETAEASLQRELRRNSERLTVSGRATMLFGAWSVVKTLMTFFLERYNLIQTIREAGDFSRFQVNIAMTVIFVFVLLWISLELSFRLFLGRTSIKIAKTGKVGRKYLVLSVCVCIYYILTVVAEISLFFQSLRHFSWQPISWQSFSLQSESIRSVVRSVSRAISDNFVTFVVDMTSLSINLDMLAAALRVKKLKKALSEQGG